MSDAMIVARADKAVEFSFPFRGATWTFVVRLTAKIGDSAQVDVFEDDARVGTGYLIAEDGPMFDASDRTPLAGKTLYTEEGDDIEMDDQNAIDVWGEMLGRVWDIVRPEYLRAIGDHE